MHLHPKNSKPSQKGISLNTKVMKSNMIHAQWELDWRSHYRNHIKYIHDDGGVMMTGYVFQCTNWLYFNAIHHIVSSRYKCSSWWPDKYACKKEMLEKRRAFQVPRMDTMSIVPADDSNLREITPFTLLDRGIHSPGCPLKVNTFWNPAFMPLYSGCTVEAVIPIAKLMACILESF